MDGNTLKKICRNRLFSHLKPEDAARILAAVTYELKRHPKNRMIAFKGDRYETLLLIIDGTVSAEISDVQGHVLKVENLSAPATVAGGILFADDNRLPVNLRTTTDVQTIALSRKSLLELASADQVLLLRLLNDAGNKITFLAEKLRFIRMHNLEQKIAVYFIELHRQNHGNFFRLPYSVEELSELFGVTRPALSRSIGLLVDEGIIRREGRRYRILHPGELESRGDPDGA